MSPPRPLRVPVAAGWGRDPFVGPWGTPTAWAGLCGYFLGVASAGLEGEAWSAAVGAASTGTTEGTVVLALRQCLFKVLFK